MTQSTSKTSLDNYMSAYNNIEPYQNKRLLYSGAAVVMGIAFGVLMYLAPQGSFEGINVGYNLIAIAGGIFVTGIAIVSIMKHYNAKIQCQKEQTEAHSLVSALRMQIDSNETQKHKESESITKFKTLLAKKFSAKDWEELIHDINASFKPGVPIGKRVPIAVLEELVLASSGHFMMHYLDMQLSLQLHPQYEEVMDSVLQTTFQKMTTHDFDAMYGSLQNSYFSKNNADGKHDQMKLILMTFKQKKSPVR